MTVELRAFSRIILATISAIGVSAVWELDLDFGATVGGMALYLLSGLFFAAGVLFPYIRQDRFFFLRAAALVAASIVSYRTAIWIATDSLLASNMQVFGTSTFGWISFTAASIAGALIVMLAIPLLAPFRVSRAYAGLGMLAAVTGGLVASRTLGENSLLLVTSGHVTWHVLVCLAIYYGRSPGDTDYQAIP